MKTVEDLKKLRDEVKHLMDIRSTDGINKIVISMGTYGVMNGAREVMAKFLDVLAEKGLTHIMVTQSGMVGTMEEQVIVSVYHRNTLNEFKNVTVDKVEEIIKSTIVVD